MALWINDGLHEAAADIHSFLLVGQSNMAGRGDLPGLKRRVMLLPKRV